MQSGYETLPQIESKNITVPGWSDEIKHVREQSLFCQFTVIIHQSYSNLLLFPCQKKKQPHYPQAVPIETFPYSIIIVNIIDICGDSLDTCDMQYGF